MIEMDNSIHSFETTEYNIITLLNLDLSVKTL